MSFANFREKHPWLTSILLLYILGILVLAVSFPIMVHHYHYTEAEPMVAAPAPAHVVNTTESKEVQTPAPEQPQNNKPKRIFESSLTQPRLTVELRQKAAQDLEGFLNRVHLSGKNLEAINFKFLPVGLHIDGEGKVTLIEELEWKRLLKKHEKLLKTLEQVRAERLKQQAAARKNKPQQAGQETAEPRERLAPTINPQAEVKEPVKPDTVTEQEEEEEVLENMTPRERRIYERELKLRGYLYHTFQQAINHVDRRGNRRTIVGDYLNDTIDHYQEETRRSDYYPPN